MNIRVLLLGVLLVAAGTPQALQAQAKKKKSLWERLREPVDKKKPAPKRGQQPGKPGLFDRLFGSDDNDVQTERERRELSAAEREYNAYVRSGDYKSALAALRRYQAIQDSLVATRLQVEAARAQAERAEAEALVARAEAAAAQTRTYGIGAGLVLALGMAAVSFKAYRDRRRSAELLAAQNRQLQHANAEITAQREQLAWQHREILDSLAYARRIQEAILPAMQQMAAALPMSFVFYRPKDIVSGDFFWFHQTPTHTLVAAVDCTGHGVPGAFMSVLGMSLLHQIVTESPALAAGEVLTRLHQGVIHSLKQQVGAATQDGMDLVLVAIDHEHRQLQVAGAHNPLYLVRDGQLADLKTDKAPIGGGRYAGHQFSTHYVDLQPGDTLYLFSDGYADQFGGPAGRKFTYRRLRELLLRLQPEPMGVQGQRVAEAFEQWRGTNEQVDDVLLLGIRV